MIIIIMIIIIMIIIIINVGPNCGWDNLDEHCEKQREPGLSYKWFSSFIELYNNH